MHLCSGRVLLFVFKVEEYASLSTHWKYLWMYLSVSGGLGGGGYPVSIAFSLGSPSHTLYSSRTSISPSTADSVRPPVSCCCLTCSVFPLTSHVESSNPFLLILQGLKPPLALQAVSPSFFVDLHSLTHLVSCSLTEGAVVCQVEAYWDSLKTEPLSYRSS